MARIPPKDGDASAGPPQQQPPAPSPQQTPMSPPAPAPRPDWVGMAVSTARAAAHWLAQPRQRTAFVGVGLLLIGAVIAAGSVWTLPLVIVGVVMVIVAWVGHRLGGHVGVTWGEHGAEIAVRARVSPASAPETTVRPAIAHETVAADARPEPDDVIDGQAHTVEIDVEELKSLIAAAEAADRPQTPTVHALRVPRNRRAAS